MDDRIRYASKGGVAVVVIALVSVPLPYPAASTLMWVFLFSLLGAMVLAITSFDQPAPADGPPGPEMGPSRSTDSGRDVPYKREMLFGFVGATAVSAAILLGILAF